MVRRYFQHKQLVPQLREMRKRGGRVSKAATEVDAILQRIQRGDEDPFAGTPITKHGESRLAHCIKYDLMGFARLVTVLYGDVQILLFAGAHEDEDKWLERHRGLIFAIDDNNVIHEMTVSSTSDAKKITAEPDNWHGRLLDRLDSTYRDKLFGDLPSRETEPLREIFAGATADRIEYSTQHIASVELRTAIFDVLTKLNAGDVDGARLRIDLLNGRIRPIAEISSDDLIEVKDGDSVRRIQVGSSEYEDWISKFLHTANYYDWFLFMHPEQERFVKDSYSGPAKLSGVSGSGKTCIAVRRAIRLAREMPHEKIAIVTLNRSLAALIAQLADYACPDPEVRSRIHITSFFSLCQELLHQFEPQNDKLYKDVTWKLEEHIDEVFREYYRLGNNYTKAEVMLPIHRSLTALGIDAETYIREEFDWIRSAVPANDRALYLEIERYGRGMPLDRERRDQIVQGLSFWEDKMTRTGVIDYLGLTTALSRHIEQIGPIFRSIIVDEAQDFGTTELALLRRMAAPAENDLFFCGDLAQHILPKHQTFSDAGIEITGRSFGIHRNYRNSREILRAAYAVLVNNLDEALLKSGELELLDPTYANRSSAEPIVLEAPDLETEISAALALMKDNAEAQRNTDQGREHRGCIAVAGYTLYEISLFGEQHGIPVLDGSRGFSDGTLFLSDLEQTKGYEFDTMIVVNCRKGVLPPEGAPPDEAFRFGCQLYVAMTRAREQLVLSYSGEPSDWLANKKVGVELGRWEDFVDISQLLHIGTPGHLPERVDSESDDIMVLNGRDFLFTCYARNLPVDVQQKLEELVPGEARLRGAHRVSWKSVGQLLGDMESGWTRGRSGFVFGPKADSVVKDTLDRARSGLRPIARRPSRSAPALPTQNAIVVPEPLAARVATQASDPLSRTLRSLELTTPTYVALHENGIRTIGDAVAFIKGGRRTLKKRTLQKLPQRNLLELQRKLAELGIFISRK